MATLRDRPNTALLVVDVQGGVLEGAHDRDAVIANIAAVMARARRAGVPVVWAQHASSELKEGTQAWRFVEELTPAGDEPVVAKRYADAFEQTSLEAVLAERAVSRLIFAGAQTDECIRATLHGALVRGYDAILVSDAHTTEDLSAWGAPPPAMVIAHTNLYWANHTAPGRDAGTATAAAVTF